MFRFSSPVLVAVGVFAAVGFVHAGTRAETMVADCRQEAIQGHFRIDPLLPLPGPGVAAHRSRMAALCARWLTVKADARQELLADCLAEAARGPRVWDHGLDVGYGHIARQKEFCRKLAETVTD
jgi:hypothetical protein